MAFKKGHKTWNKGLKGLKIGTKKGAIFSDIHRKNIGLASKKMWKNSEYRKRMSELKKDIPLSEIHRQNISNALKGKMPKNINQIAGYNKGKKRPEFSGDKHWNWKGGISPINQKIRGSLEYSLWEHSVFAKDCYYCQKCKEIMTPYKLVAHHIKNFAQYPELRFAIDNGITFCRECHKEFHHLFSKKNNTLEQVIEFINIQL